MIRRLTENDITAVHSLECACFVKPWDPSVIAETIKRDEYLYLGAFSGDELVGYISLNIILDECYVNRIATSPEHRRKGIADEMMNATIDIAKKRCSFISLEVRASNAAAIALYEKHGFEKAGLRRGFYDEPTEDGIIMTLKLM